MNKYLYLSAIAVLACSGSYGQLHVTTGATKNVLLENATGAWAGFCPDAQQDIIQSVQTIPHVIALNWHNGDSMMIPGDPYNSGTGYVLGFPQGTIDRADIGGTTAQNRPYETTVGARTSLTPNFQVDMSTSYNPSTRVVTVTVTGKALSSLSGHWNINAFVGEDSVSSATAGNQQHSYYDTITHASNGMACWYTGLGAILPAADYAHMDVVRAILAPGGNIWGDPAFTNPASGTIATKTYSYTLPAGYNASKIFVVGLVQKYGTSPGDSVIENAVSTKGNMIPPGALSGASDSLSAYTNALCSISEFFVTTHSYASGLTVATDYGDGTSGTAPLLSAHVGGYVDMTHSYATSGTYTVKHILYSGTTALDSVSYSYAYTLCNQFPVFFYFDANSNCIKDSTEPFIYQPFLTRVDSNGVTVDSISSTSGFYYNAYGHTSDVYTFTVMTTPPGLTITCPSTASLNDTLGADSTITSKYFGASCGTGSTFDVRVFASAHTGRHHFGGGLIVDNTYCALETGTVTMQMDPKYNYTSSSITPTSVTGGTIVWNVPGLSSIAPAPVYIRVDGEVPGTWLIPGDTVLTTAHIDPTTGDADTTNNNCIQIDTVRSSYDPNYMSVTPSGYIPATTHTLQYAIGFENTGNDTAHNIYVMDTLSDNVAAASLKLITSSAKMFVTNLRDLAGHNIVKFDFPQINLPDSSHHNQCNGLVVFNVNLKSGLSNGATIFNHAGIFFDDNPVVMTNTVTDIIGIPNGVVTIKKTGTVQVFPNPASDVLTISMNNSPYHSCSISNSMGQLFLQQQLNTAQTKVDIKSLPAGLYYIFLKGDNDSEVRKFIKQ